MIPLGVISAVSKYMRAQGVSEFLLLSARSTSL
jgi:hypothetical protein